MKEKKLIIGFTAIIVLIIAIVAVVRMNKEEESQTSAPQPVATTAVVDDGGTNFWDNVEIFEGDGDQVIIDADGETSEDLATDADSDVSSDETKAENKTKAEDGETVEGISIQVEEGDNDAPTDDSGETISEEYPGQAAGWSPLVSPDDLN